MRTDYTAEPSPFTVEWDKGLQREVRAYNPSPADRERAAGYKRAAEEASERRRRRACEPV